MELDVYKEWLGIPEGDRPPDHYTLLRLVEFEDDPDKVRAHYKKLNAHVRKYATGQYSKPSQDLLNELAKAMLCLTDPERKREYDESQGREFDDNDELTRLPLGTFLVRQKHITTDQLKEVEYFADARGLSMRDAVVQMKLVSGEIAAQAFAQELGLSYVDLNEMIPDDFVLDQLPRATVRRYRALPLFEDDNMLLVACLEEPTPDLEDEIRLRFDIPMRGVIAEPLAINQSITKYYAPGMRDETVAAQQVSGGKKPKGGGKSSPKRSDSGGTAFSQLPPDQQQQRKQLGYILMMWSFVGSVLIDQFLLLPARWWPSWLPFCVSLVIPPVAVWWVLKRFWK